MAEPDQVTLAVILFVIGLVIVSFLEIRFLRKRMKGRRIRAARRERDLPDEAHNAIITTKAIHSALERQGIRSEEAATWLREAQLAYNRGNYRVAVDLTARAKERLMATKAAQSARGDLAKLEQMASAGTGAEVTTKERIQKDFPPNLIQSKFSIEIAESAIEHGRLEGRDVTRASQVLDVARIRYDAKDYDGALHYARQSKRLADGESVEVTLPPSAALEPPPVATPIPPASARVRPCPSCGAGVEADDAFCRKCGARLPNPSCASCGAEVGPDDEFCRKCGAPVPK